MSYTITTDLDGTLLNKKSKITLRTLLYMRGLQKNGHYIVIATGRQYHSAKKFIDRLKPDYAICDNGGSIYSKNGERIFFRIDKEMFLGFLKEIKEHVLGVISTDYENICIENEPVIPRFCKHIDNDRRLSYGKMEDILNHGPINPCIIITPDGLKKAEAILNDKYKGEIGYRYWHYKNNYNLELYKYGYDKGGALRKVHKLIGLDMKYSIAFGDEKNDLELIKAAHYGIAMKNSSEELIDSADFVTAFDNNHNGVIKFISYLFKNEA